MSRIISINIDYKNYDETYVSAFETALSAAIASTSFEYNGSRTYKRTFALTEDPDTIYKEWLSIVDSVYNSLTTNLCIFSSYDCVDYFCPMV